MNLYFTMLFSKIALSLKTASGMGYTGRHAIPLSTFHTISLLNASQASSMVYLHSPHENFRILSSFWWIICFPFREWMIQVLLPVLHSKPFSNVLISHISLSIFESKLWKDLRKEDVCRCKENLMLRCLSTNI